MKQFMLIFLVLTGACQALFAQEGESSKFYLGASFGTSFSLGNFRDTDISNPDAGFAKNGQRFDIYAGFFLDKNEKVTLATTFRYQRFETEIEDLINEFTAQNPGVNFSGSIGDWQVYYLLVGIAYKVKVTKKFAFYPRFGLGPMVINNPGINVNSPDVSITQNLSRSSETGFGLGYELGIGLRTDLGKHFSLMPTFTFSGGFTNISDVVTSTDNVSVISDYQPTVLSFNIGLSLAYRFY